MNLNKPLRTFWRFTLTNLMRPFIQVTMTGRENLPKEGDAPLIIIANHFSYYDPLILLANLPFLARFMAAIEMTRIPFFSHLLKVFEGIPVWRGQIDRDALKVALDHLDGNGIIGVFPEGGIIPELQEKVARGEKIVDVPNSKSRIPAILAKARPGTAYVATMTPTSILPIALIGTEQIEGNLKRWKRTHVEIRIGQPFGPYHLEPELKGKRKRRVLDRIGDEMMEKIAELLPQEMRGEFTRKRLRREKPSPPSPLSQRLEREKS